VENPQGVTEPEVEEDEEIPVMDGMELAGDEDVEDPMELLDSSDEEDNTEGAVEVPTHRGERRERDDTTTSDTPPRNDKRQRLDMIAEILGLSTASKLVADIEAKMPRIAGNRRQKRSARLQESKVHVTELYSPPRVVESAERHGLILGWSLDLTTTDPETGQPWDLSKPEVQNKVRMKIREDKPLFLMASPPCGAFCTWMHVNYSHMDEDKAQETVWNAMRHLAFTVEMCLLQARDGRFYALEHPNGAMSWSTGIM
jgi:hypothetical protein